MKIKFSNIDNVEQFVNSMQSLECDVNIVDGHQVFDAKSLVGVMNLDMNKAFYVYCITHDENQRAKFNQEVKQFEVV